jgi:hypothetical protein
MFIEIISLLLFLFFSIYLYNWIEIYSLKCSIITDNSYYVSNYLNNSQSESFYLKRLEEKFKNNLMNFENDDKYISKYIISENVEMIKSLSMLNLNKKIFLWFHKHYILTNKYKLYNFLNECYKNEMNEINENDIILKTYFPKKNYKELLKTHNDSKCYFYISCNFNKNDNFKNQNYVYHKLGSLETLNNQNLNIIQEFMFDTLLYKNYKVSPRLYIIIKVINNNYKVFLHNDGIIRYSNKPVYDNSHSLINSQPNYVKLYSNSTIGISNFNTDLIENGFPSNLKDLFKSYKNSNLENKFWESCVKKLETLFNHLLPVLIKNEYNFVQMFSIDTFVNSLFEPFILGFHEINKDDYVYFDKTLLNSLYEYITIENNINDKFIELNLNYLSRFH